MSEYQEPVTQVYENNNGTPRWVGLAVAVLAVVSVLGLGAGLAAYNRATSVEKSAQESVKQSNDTLGQRLAKAEDQNQQLQSDLHVVTDKLNVTQADLVAARRQTKVVAADYGKKLTGLETSVKSELATKASTDDVTKLNGDLTGVRGDLDKTNGSIQMARSEMGTLIARNHDEIDQLRRMGQRDYYEFSVTRKAGAQRVGTIQVDLKNTNTKKNQYSVDILSDDKTYEKKNRSVNEPIFFYTGGSRAALEFVVNKVSKTTASGYLSVPKSAGTASASTTTSGQ